MPLAPKIALSLPAALLSLSAAAAQETFEVTGSAGTQLSATVTSAFDRPWAMTMLPDGRMLVTEKGGALVLVSAEGARLGEIDGVPGVRVAGQGGFGDVQLHPDFAETGLVYLSYIEWEGDRSGAVVERATLDLTETGGRLGPLSRVWTQEPKGETTRHYSHRLLFDGEGHLFVTSGDRGRQTPAQDMSVNWGKTIRLNEDGTIPADNPFVSEGGVAAQFWSMGHRNQLGIAFAPDGTLWAHEMGPRGGDELNRIERGGNYGWPIVSDGVNYSGVSIPDHDTNAGERFAAPAISWVPSISPSGLVIYDGDLFADWRGDALMGGLSSQAIVRVSLDGGRAVEAERYSWDWRIREVEEGPDGALWVLEDQEGGRLIRLDPR